jgi:streptomycin 6-kinase
VVIDPKGYIGNLYNEVWPFIHDPEIEVAFVAKKLGLDAAKLTKWCFVHGLLAATWCLEDGIDPNRVLELVSKIFKMLSA